MSSRKQTAHGSAQAPRRRGWRHLLPVALVLAVLLSACGGPKRNDLHYFGAEAGNGAADGTWLLRWNVNTSGTVTLDGQTVAASGTRAVSPATLTEYVLKSGAETRTLQLGPLSVRLAGEPPREPETGMTFSVRAVVEAPDSEARPGIAATPDQRVTWSSSDEAIAQVDSQSGSVSLLNPGPVTITATSRQDPRASTSFDLDVALEAAPHIIAFELIEPADSAGLDAGDEITVGWDTAAAGVELVEVVTGGHERTVISLEGPAGQQTVTLPADKREVNYVLRARNRSGAETEEGLWPDSLPLPHWVCSDPQDVITFFDSFIEAQVRAIYIDFIQDKAEITCGDVRPHGNPHWYKPKPDADGMEQHHAIVARRCGVDDDPLLSSLEGVQHLIYLRRLDVSCNELTDSDLRWLESLAWLEELDLDGNPGISDLAPLAGLGNLRVLGLSENGIEDISVLAGLPELEILYLSENRITDLSPLAGLENVRHLWLYLNCSDITENAAGDPERWSGCLSDLSPLSGFTRLESLLIGQNEVADLSPLAGLPRLEALFASGNNIRDLDALAGLPALNSVRLDGNFISSLAPLVANPDFPAGPPFSFRRGTASLPTVRDDYADDHLTLHYNCLDPADPGTRAAYDEMVNRGTNAAGFEVSQNEPRCAALSGAGLISGQAAQPAAGEPFPEEYLRELSNTNRR